MGKMPVRMSDIARELGCSISQVSRALSGKPKVAPDVRRKILELAHARNYRNCANCHIPRFAVLSDWCYEFSTGIINCLIRLSQKHKFHFAAISKESWALLNEQHFDGAISICGTVMARDWHERFKIPLVVVNSVPCFFEAVGAVVPDADGESIQAVEHLTGLGHRRIARIRVNISASRPADVGTKAFDAAAEQFHIRDSVTQDFFKTYDSDDFRKRIVSLLDEGCTAFIFTGSDDCESFFIPFLKSLGKRIPEDVSVIGYKSNPFFYKNHTNSLTRFAFDFEALAANTVELLHNEMSGKVPPEQRKIPTPLIIGATTGPAPAG